MDAKLEFKCLKRYLKECGVYTPFLRYLGMERLRNITRDYSHYKGLDTIGVLSEAIMRGETVYVTNIISAMIVWEKTKEGHGFWSRINADYKPFREEYLKQHGGA